jgi:hypothetical protein
VNWCEIFLSYKCWLLPHELFICRAGVRLGRYFEKRCKELGLQLKEEELRPPEAKKARFS